MSAVRTINNEGSILYEVRTSSPVLPNDPLHVGNFYRDKQRHHQKTSEERQALILFLAQLHREAMKSKMPLAFRRIPISLTKLRSWVYDYRVAFDFFFEVQNTGYRISDENKELSFITPRVIPQEPANIIKKRDLEYCPPELPDAGEVSKVFIQFQNAGEIRRRIEEESRYDLLAPVEWLLKQPTDELNFWFVRAGKLQLRDTSVWPIRGIETWPSWLRVLLFGDGVDIESAYTQYLLQAVKESGMSDTRYRMLFPELIDSFENKREWRENLCTRMGMEISDANIGVVKKICMALANGGKISGNIISGQGTFSSVKCLILEAMPDADLEQLVIIGNILSRIAREYNAARRIVCLSETKKFPSRQNQKSVFRTYFQWERDARYKIWESIGRMGIMVHDGIDGIPPELQKMAVNAALLVGIKATME